MFIAHLPVGYLIGKFLPTSFDRTAYWLMLVGSILPDLDLLLFYFRDGQAVHHHTYLTHRPLLWGAVTLIGLLISRMHVVGTAFFTLGLAGLMHMLLDTIAGAINWGWPWFNMAGPMVVVPATQNHWILSFLTHWTFAVELVICAVVYFVWRRTRQRKSPGE